MPAMFAQILPTSFPRHIFYIIYIGCPSVRTRIQTGEKIFTIKKHRSVCKQRRKLLREKYTYTEYILCIHYTQQNKIIINIKPFFGTDKKWCYFRADFLLKTICFPINNYVQNFILKSNCHIWYNVYLTIIKIIIITIIIETIQVNIFYLLHLFLSNLFACDIII
jgi:hypothetical protein